jgi:hypothetical protein
MVFLMQSTRDLDHRNAIAKQSEVMANRWASRWQGRDCSTGRYWSSWSSLCESTPRPVVFRVWQPLRRLRSMKQSKARR